MHCILSDAVAIFTVQSTVNTLLLIRADELSVNWDIRLVAGRPWKRVYYSAIILLCLSQTVPLMLQLSLLALPCTVTVRLQVRLFAAASVAVYWTSVSPTGNREPGLWVLATVRRPPKKEMNILTHIELLIDFTHTVLSLCCFSKVITY